MINPVEYDSLGDLKLQGAHCFSARGLIKLYEWVICQRERIKHTQTNIIKGLLQKQQTL